ncbi:MAG TPA: phosphoribosylformylglycinamidine synthase subunit PurS [Elusimicrobiota bacterium]|nr:phosphoribosylformylglycinamidine synthase subunit PurS [Elusimicrobiota bacterium]
MNWRVFVSLKPRVIDHRGRALEAEWRHAKLPSLDGIGTGQVYELSGSGLSDADVQRLTESLLTDPITQTGEIVYADHRPTRSGVRRVRIWPKPGVSDPPAETVMLGARDLGCDNIERVRTGFAYEFRGPVSRQDVKTFCERYLMNDLVQTMEME